jgi:hypothetical protein
MWVRDKDVLLLAGNNTCAIYGWTGQKNGIALFVYGESTTGMVKNLLLDEGVFGKAPHSQEERRRGILL